MPSILPHEGMKKNTDLKTSAPAAHAAHAAPPDAAYTRLHITPLDPQLLKVVVPSAVLPHARNISFHSIQTFPEKSYGFIDLPTSDADKIKKKLHGAVLKGAKIQIEPARPVNMPRPSPDAIVNPTDGVKSKKPKSEKREKKRKRDAQEVVGVELEEGRKVKRGWTVTPEEAAEKKKKEKEEERKLAKSKKKEEKKKKQKNDPESKYSEGPECLVRTTLPPNKLDMADGITGGDKKKAKKGKKRDVVVHEFEKNTKFATFLKTAQPASIAPGHTGAGFVEGKGWVNEDGTVVEKVKSTRPTEIPKLQVKTRQATPESAADDDTTSSSGSSSEDESELPPRSVEQISINHQPTSPAEDDTSASDSANEVDSARPKSASSIRSLTIRIPPATPTPASTSHKIHPLEALYKRQKQDEASPNKPSADSEPFAFFGGQDIDEDEDMTDGQNGEGSGLEGSDGGDDHPTSSQGPQPPMTPFTKQDFEWRNTRSAAPTPDTAHPSRMSRIWYQRGDEDKGLDDVEEDQGEDDNDNHSMAGQGRALDGEDAGEGSTNPNTDFQKWFWEHRGDLNRSWKKRRKTAGKEKRYRENRARADRAI